MLWQLPHDTSFVLCLPASQKESWRLPAWQLRQADDFSEAGLPLACLSPTTGFLPRAATCSFASPWQDWQALPLASFLAPWAVPLMESLFSSWHLLQTGSAPWALTGADHRNATDSAQAVSSFAARRWCILPPNAPGSGALC